MQNLLLKKYIFIAIIFLTVFHSFAEKSNYALAFDAWRKGEKEKAVEYMRLSYNEKPDSNKLAWYTYYLEDTGHFIEIMSVMEKAPKELWVDGKYYTETYRHYAEALRQLRYRKEAVEILIEAIDLDKPDAGKALLPLVKWVWTESYLSHEFKMHKRYHEILKTVITQLRKNWKEHSYITEHIFDFCITAAAEEIAKQNKELSDFYINTAIEITEKSDIGKRDSYQPARAGFFRDAVSFWREHDPLKKGNAYPFKILCIWYPRIKAKAVYKGEKLDFDLELSREHIENKIRELRTQFQAVSLAYYYMSEGKLLLSFDFKVMDGTVREVEGVNSLVPVIESIDPDPGAFYHETFNEYDGYIHFYPRIPANFLGGRSRMVFVPYFIYSEHYRHHCWLSCGAYYGAIIHEMFHNFEGIYDISPTHGFKEENKNKWPDWYKKYVQKNGRPCEIEYYHGCFTEYMNPSGFEEVHYRENYKTNLTADDIRKYGEMLEKYSPAKLKQAEELYIKGMELKGRKKIKEAIDAFNKAVELFPPHYKSYYMLGYIHMIDLKEREKALEYYEKSLGIYPYDRGTLVMAGFCCRVLKRFDRAGEIYKMIIDMFGVNPWMAFYYGMSLCETGNEEDAVPWLEKALELGYENPEDVKRYLEKCKT
ncbi:MAG: hypothetical protein JW969_11610 [Spirochaetales bacterium]|nr:hypothetical protein [Spirochaetales bacterium]